MIDFSFVLSLLRGR